MAAPAAVAFITGAAAESCLHPVIAAIASNPPQTDERRRQPITDRLIIAWFLFLQGLSRTSGMPSAPVHLHRSFSDSVLWCRRAMPEDLSATHRSMPLSAANRLGSAWGRYSPCLSCYRRYDRIDRHISSKTVAFRVPRPLENLARLVQDRDQQQGFGRQPACSPSAPCCLHRRG